MLSFYEETTESIMGNGPNVGERIVNDTTVEDTVLKPNLQLEPLNQRQIIDRRVFFASTDKAPIVSQILEARGWLRTKDFKVTNFTIKWCLANQVDWAQFQEGKQLINNIPGQLAFSDKINLWYNVKDYLNRRRTSDGNHIQFFLPLSFILDNDEELAEFLRYFKKQTRPWICKPRYNYAGRGIYVLTAQSDLNTIFKLKNGVNNNSSRLQHEPKLPGHLIQEYISRPLLIKGRKFDIRVHWLIAWTKPILAFYNHNASVVRLSLNLYREFDFDRATHLTNLSVQENHHRYPFSQEATGMTIQQLNHYFNQCFRPFHPRMCQDWVMTIMQERMQTIIRHVIRATKDKLTRNAGYFGLYGCDFLLDENFRIWLLEVNDNPGVGWGNSRVNTTTKPLFEETLDIILECFNKHQEGVDLLPIQCLKNYQLFYNENDDVDKLLRDDNQLITERLSIRYGMKEASSRSSIHRMLQRIKTSRTLPNQAGNNNNHTTLPSLANISIDNASTTNLTGLDSSGNDTIKPSDASIINTTLLSMSTNKLTSIRTNLTDDVYETIEPLKHDDDIELERLIKPTQAVKMPEIKKCSMPMRNVLNNTIVKRNKTSIKRTLSTTNTYGPQRKPRIDLTPVVFDKKYSSQRNSYIPEHNSTNSKENQMVYKKPQLDYKGKANSDQQSSLSIAQTDKKCLSPELCSFN